MYKISKIDISLEVKRELLIHEEGKLFHSPKEKLFIDQSKLTTIGTKDYTLAETNEEYNIAKQIINHIFNYPEKYAKYIEVGEEQR